MISTIKSILKTNKSKLLAVVHSLSQRSAWASISLVLIFVFGYAFVAIPFGDDYGRATTFSIEKAIHRVISDYFNWTGRWASMTLQYGAWAINKGEPQYFFRSYRLLILLLLLVNVFAWYFIVKLVTVLRGWKAVVLALGVGGTYLSVFHSPGETLYWLPGAAEGGLSSLLVALLVWGSMPLISGGLDSFSLSKNLLVAVGIFICAGLHEIGGMFLVSFYSTALVWKTVSGQGWHLRVLSIFLIASVLATCISVFAPGNSIRAATEGMQTGSLLNVLNSGSQITLRTLRTVLSPPLLLGFAILVISATSYPNIPSKVSAKVSAFLCWAVPLSLVTVAALVAWKTATTPAARTVNFFASTLVYIFIPALTIWLSNLIQKNNRNFRMQVPTCLWALFALSMLLSPTLDRAFFSYKTQFPHWILYQNSKHLILSNAQKSGIVILDEPPPAPPMFFTETDITSDPKAWINQVQSNFYGVSTISLKKKLETPGFTP
jgi:hypothetical protein